MAELTNDELRELSDNARLINNVDIERRGLRWANIDNWRKVIKQPHDCAIINTDIAAGPGIHWIVFYMLANGKIFIYDPLGKQNLRQWRGNPPRSAVFFSGRSQLATSKLCGYFSIIVAKALIKRAPKTAAECNAIISKLFGLTADLGDVKKVAGEFIR